MNWKAGHCFIAIMAYGSILAGCSTSDKSVDTGSLTNSCNDFNKKLKRSGEDIYFKDQLINYQDPEIYTTIADICDKIQTIDTSLKESQKSNNIGSNSGDSNVNTASKGNILRNSANSSSAKSGDIPYHWLSITMIAVFIGMFVNIIILKKFYRKLNGEFNDIVLKSIREAIGQHIKDVHADPSNVNIVHPKGSNFHSVQPIPGAGEGSMIPISVVHEESAAIMLHEMNESDVRKITTRSENYTNDHNTNTHNEIISDNSKLIDWHWIQQIFGQDGIQVGADEFDHIVRKNSTDIYNIYLRNNLLVLDPFVDATAPTAARLLLLRLPVVSSAMVIPSYGFANRFANTTTAVANYGSSDVSTFFEMFEDGTNQLKVAHPAFINFSGNELDVNSIRKGELRGFTR